MGGYYESEKYRKKMIADQIRITREKMKKAEKYLRESIRILNQLEELNAPEYIIQSAFTTEELNQAREHAGQAAGSAMKAYFTLRSVRGWVKALRD